MDKEERRKDKKEKKDKRSEKDGVHKSKKDKKEKKATQLPVAEDSDPALPLLQNLENGNGEIEAVVKTAPLLGALVPFANPLADEKVGKKVLKSVKKGMQNLTRAVRVSTIDTAPLSSRQEQIPQARRQRSRQMPPQIHTRYHVNHRLSSRYCCPRGGHLTNGRHLSHPCALRRPWHTLYFRPFESGAGRGGEHEEAYECGDGQSGEGWEEGGESGGGG